MTSPPPERGSPPDEEAPHLYSRSQSQSGDEGGTSTTGRSPHRRRRIKPRSPPLRPIHDDGDVDLVALDVPPPILPPSPVAPSSRGSVASGSARTFSELNSATASAIAPNETFEIDLEAPSASGTNASATADGAPEGPPLPPPRSSVSLDVSRTGNETDGQPCRTYDDYKKKVGPYKAGFSVSRDWFLRNWGILLFLAVLALMLALLGILSAPFKTLRWSGWVAFAIVSLTLALLVSNAIPTEISMLIGLTLMLVFRIVEPVDALAGFSNPGVAAVAVLFIVAEGVQRTSILLPVFRVLLGKPRWLWEAQIRLMLPVAIISAFLNNTPVVAMMIPVIQSWSRRAGFPVSKLLMPLNNAAILGGTMTLLGTSTNLVVAGLAKEYKLLESPENPSGDIAIFAISPIGAILLVVGIIYMLIFSRLKFLLPDRGQTGVGAYIGNPREYTVALLVEPRSAIVGETVQDAGLRQLEGLFLVELTREDGEVIPAVSPDTHIRANDILLFAGVVETVRELYHIQGLVPAAGQSRRMKLERHRRRLVELVISASSSLAGKTAKESKFRSRFNAAIIAVHRQGEHVKERIGEITLRAGDTLLVETCENFIFRFGKDVNFALVSEVSGSQPPREDRLHMAIALVTVVTMISLVTANIWPLVTAAAVASFVMIATACISFRNAAQSVSIPVILTIAASFGVSAGMEKSGAAAALAGFIVNIFQNLGQIGLLFGIYVGTALLSAVITNNAAVTLMFPVIRNIVTKPDAIIGTNAALYTLMIAASSSFSTPIGYQTNLMVHGPGGYTFMDWVAFGIPLQLLLGAAGVLSIHFLVGHA